MADDPLYQINHTLGRLESKIDQALAYGDRITKLETWQSSMNQKVAWIAGVFSVLGSVITLMINKIIAWLSSGAPH